MNNFKHSAASFLLAGFTSFVSHQAFAQSMDMTPITLPAECGQADMAAMEKLMPDMADMDMAKMDMSGMDEAQTAGMAAMMKMHTPMMQGMMAKDPDVAFACGMIAHHQGAIDMSQIELKYGDDAEAKKMAQMIIDAQMKEIEQFKAILAAKK